jgi:hypothetical protein
MLPQVLERCNIVLRTHIFVRRMQIFGRSVRSEAISDSASPLLEVLADSSVDVLGTLITFNTYLHTRA